MVKVIVTAVRAKINVFFFIMLHWFSMIHARLAPDVRYNAGIICTLHDNIAIFWNMRKPSSRHENLLHRTKGIEHSDYCHSHVSKNSLPHGGDTESRQNQKQQFHPESECNVLMHNAYSPA